MILGNRNDLGATTIRATKMKDVKVWLSSLAVLVGVSTSACTKKTPLSSDPSYRALLGTKVMQREALLFSLRDAGHKSRLLGADFEMIDKDASNDWRKDGWVKAGTELTVLEVNRYEIDGRGPWVGVVGTVAEPESGKRVRFVYSYEPRFQPAPWEVEPMPRTRPEHPR